MSDNDDAAGCTARAINLTYNLCLSLSFSVNNSAEQYNLSQSIITFLTIQRQTILSCT